jgi:hypothetical protein
MAYVMIRKAEVTPEEPPVDPETVQMGVNVSWFNTWNESQPLANVACQGRTTDYSVLPVDANGDPIHDFELGLYEGVDPGGTTSGGGAGGAQTGSHSCRFNGSATVTGTGGGVVSAYSYDSGTNLSTFTYTTTEVLNCGISFTNTKRTNVSDTNTGITNLKMMRPGHTFTDFLNNLFVTAMTPFTCFRVGPNWDAYTYMTTAPVWADRVKPDKIQYGGENADGSVAWETLAKVANDMEMDLWICIPPNASDTYLTNLFNLFLYGSDGVNAYTSVQGSPVWAPLDSTRKLYFEIANEVWNWAAPYGTATNQMDELAHAEFDAGDAHDYMYAEAEYGVTTGLRRRLGYLTVHASLLCRSIVGSKIMTQFRPVLAGQAASDYQGKLSMSYIRCVYGGYDFYTDWESGGWPGKYKDLVTTEDGTANSFGNAARPVSYYLYGYATAPYTNGATIAELQYYYSSLVYSWIADNIATATEYGITALGYEGGIETFRSYTDTGIGDVVETLLTRWFNLGGGVFCYYSFCGNYGSGLIPDLTRQDPDDWPKIKAVRNVVGL